MMRGVECGLLILSSKAGDANRGFAPSERLRCALPIDHAASELCGGGPIRHAMQRGFYGVDMRPCERCGRDTKHEVYESGHERDSSSCWQQCLECPETSDHE